MIHPSCIPDVACNPAVSHRAILEFTVKRGNPNMDPDTKDVRRDSKDHVLVTDVRQKRYIRDYIERNHKRLMFVKRSGEMKELPDGQRTLTNWGMYHLSKTSDENQSRDGKIATAISLFLDVKFFGGVLSVDQTEKTKKPKKVKKGSGSEPSQQEEPSAEEGSESATEKDNGKKAQLRGPIQFGYGRSTQPVPLSITETITRVVSEKGEQASTMGTRTYVEDVDFTQEVRYNGTGGTINGVTSDELRMFWEALVNQFEDQRSTLGGEQYATRLTIRSYPNALAVCAPGESPTVTVIENTDY